jgi:AraC family transcriptional regulator
MDKVQVEKVNAVQRMQDFINRNITEVLTMKMLSEVSGYSQWHSSRIFTEMIGKTPFEYIRYLRLSKAALKLRDEDNRILDVALDFVFDSHEGFTRAFSKQFGMTPNYYSKHTPPIQLFLPYSIKDHYSFLKKEVNYVKTTNTIFVQVIDRPLRKLLLKRGTKATHYFEYCEEVGCDVWGVLTSIKEALYEPIGLWMPKSLIIEGTSLYTQGVEVPYDYTGIVPEGFDIIDLEPCKMMIFQGEPYEDENFEEAIEELWEVIKNYKPELYGFSFADDVAPRFQLAPMGYRGYIEGRPVVEISKTYERK